MKDMNMYTCVHVYIHVHDISVISMYVCMDMSFTDC